MPKILLAPYIYSVESVLYPGRIRSVQTAECHNMDVSVIREQLRWFPVPCCCFLATQGNNYSKFITS